jgi:hypothetical protein
VKTFGLNVRDGVDQIIPRWVALGFLVLTVGLVPWTIWLFFSLPDDHLAQNWALAWGGFDVGLGVALALTSLSLLYRSPWAGISAAVTGTLLICDAWFDITTSRGTNERLQAICLAVLVEIPLAAVCFWIARNIERVMADARPHLQRLGFRIRNRRLEPPPSLETQRD